MDAVMDLTARAVSFITLIQDTFLKGSVPSDNDEFKQGINDVFGKDFPVKFSNYIELGKAYEKEKNKELSKKLVAFEKKVIELVWFSRKSLNEEDKQKAEFHVVELCTSLAAWVVNNNLAITNKLGPFGAFSPPYIWRNAISEIIYADIDQRLALATALEYLPIHIVLALGGGKYEAVEQRILQWWPIPAKVTKIILREDELKLHEKFREDVYYKFHEKTNNTPGKEVINHFYFERVVYLLSHYKELTKVLSDVSAPLPFEYVFNEELDEIRKTRKLRARELLMVSDDDNKDTISNTTTGAGTLNNGDTTADPSTVIPPTRTYSCDPFIRARNLKLFALAFSGGGIRSATFNLGILQGLAKKGVISKVDYLSTVSGGGYIGSWLATWIKRDGSVTKVTDRLNPDKSADPLGEEVRPIRWLRMFSNYFTPDKSIMSIDSWTVGVTWLRNTLLNQLVIFLVLLSVLLLVRSSFELWLYERVWTEILPGSYVYITACLFMLIVAFLTGVGMHWYHKGQPITLPFNLHKNNGTTFLIVLIAVIGSFIVSGSLFSQPPSTFADKLNILWPVGIVTLVVLIIIAEFGGYDKCIVSFGKGNVRAKIIIFYTAAIAATVTWLSLAAAWKLFELIKVAKFAKPDALAFTAGLPLVLFVFGIMVVSRMALLGKYFPDERREWWGRMGAIINRVAFIWILISAATFLMRDLLNPLLENWKAPATLGGWMALVAGAVKAAFSSKTSGKDEAKGFQSTALDLLSKAGPYLFALGLLIFLPALLEPLIRKIIFPPFVEGRIYLKALLLAIIFFVPALYLSWRLGVNEFSMHHFYRNRLVRAYLGATRRKSTRQKTANPFTGFDRLDDEKLSRFKHEQGYYGPYPILNTALNASQVSDLSRQDRKAESFIFSPLYCGFDFSKVRSSAHTVEKSYDYGFRPTEQYAYPNDNGPGIGTAMAISGAAVNPNQGYHSSSGTAFLLTVFNVQMGWWIGNPRKRKWRHSDPNFGLAYIIYNMTGQSNTRNEFVSLSDGGHFDNMGLYELVRRRCSFIILGDGEQDENFACEGFANAIRKCRIDFGAEITIDIDGIVKRENRLSKSHYAIGTIKYSGDKQATGILLYIKSTITGDEPVDVSEYSAKNPTFPHQTTADQFFDEEQFESYRKLGMHIADLAMSDEKVLTALDLNWAAKQEEETLTDVIEKPIKNLFNTLREFFIKKTIE